MKTVNELASKFNVSKNTIRRWTKKNSGYLSKYANPAKGQARKFTQTDVDVLLHREVKTKNTTNQSLYIGLYNRIDKLEKRLQEIEAKLKK